LFITAVSEQVVS